MEKLYRNKDGQLRKLMVDHFHSITIQPGLNRFDESIGKRFAEYLEEVKEEPKALVEEKVEELADQETTEETTEESSAESEATESKEEIQSPRRGRGRARR